MKFTSWLLAALIFFPQLADAQCTAEHRIEQDFSTTSGQDVPECWEALPTNNLFQFDNGYATFYGTDRVFVLPNTTNTQGTLTFRGTHLSNKTYGGLNVLVGVWNGSTFTQVGTASYGSPGWKSFSFDFSANQVAGNIAIKTTSNGSITRLAVDDIVYQTLCVESDSAIAVAKDVTLYLDQDGILLPNASDIDGGSMKSCLAPITNLSMSQLLFTCDNLGDNEVILTADDDNGHTDSDTAIVHIAPTTNIHSNLKGGGIILDSTGTFVLTAENAVQQSTSTTCEAITYAFEKDTFTCADAGDYQYVEIHAIYGDDTASVSRNTPIYDYILPTILAQDITVTIDSLTGQAIVQPEQIDLGSHDACGVQSVTLSDTLFTCTDVGVNQVSLIVQDSSGNTNAQFVNITVESFVPATAVSVTGDEVCFNELDEATHAVVTTADTWPGITYTLKNDQDEVVDGPVVGDGSGLEFSTDTTDHNEVYYVFGEVLDESMALSLPGSNDYLEVQTPGSFDYSQAYTFQAWVKNNWTNSSQAYEPIFYAGGATGSDIEVYVTNNSSSLTVLHNRGNGGTQSYGNTAVLPTDGEYFHLAVAYNGTYLTVYVNGEPMWSDILVAPVKSSGSELTFGYMESSTFIWSQQYFNGMLDDIRLYDVARTQQQIEGDMDLCLKGTEDNLVLYYPLDEATSTIVMDLVSGVPGQIKSGGGLTPGLTDDNAISCSFVCNRIMADSVFFGDFEAPMVMTMDTLINLNEEASITIDSSWVNDGSFDNCSVTSMWLSKHEFVTADSADGGMHTVVLYVEDAYGNVDSAEATVTVIDNPALITSSNELKWGDVNVYPNPSNGLVNIQSSGSDAIYQVYSAAGQLMEAGRLNAGTQTIDLSEVPGVYTLMLLQQDQVLVHKLIVR